MYRLWLITFLDEFFFDCFTHLGSELSKDTRNFDKRIKPILSLWRKLNEVNVTSLFSKETVKI